jgi:hypothetical protein
MLFKWAVLLLFYRAIIRNIFTTYLLLLSLYSVVAVVVRTWAGMGRGGWRLLSHLLPHSFDRGGQRLRWVLTRSSPVNSDTAQFTLPPTPLWAGNRALVYTRRRFACAQHCSAEATATCFGFGNTVAMFLEETLFRCCWPSILLNCASAVATFMPVIHNASRLFLHCGSAFWA